MKNLFTIIVASLLLGTTSMAASDPDFVIVSAEHTGVDNIHHISTCVQTIQPAISTLPVKAIR